MNLVCVLTEKDISQISTLKRYKNYIYAVEIRADTFYPKIEEISEVIKKIKKILKKVKIILTFRYYKEGGKCKISENERKKLIEKILFENFNYIDIVDIEFYSKIKNKLIKTLKKYKKKLIISCHINKKITKKQFESVLAKLQNLKNKYFIKIVIKSNNFKYYFNFLKLFYLKNIPLSSFFAIGKISLISRLISAILKMPLIYVSIRTPVVKTQPDIKTFIKFSKKLGL